MGIEDTKKITAAMKHLHNKNSTSYIQNYIAKDIFMFLDS